MTVVLVVVAVIALAAVAAAAWLYLQQRRTQDLRREFGPEYDRTVHDAGNRTKAEQVLEARKERVQALRVHALSRAEQKRFAEQWRQTQARFVDDPGAAVGEADSVIGQVMQARGYPVGDFEQRAADISVEHPDVVTNYRAAHRIALAQERQAASTEDLRQAMMHYRELFDDLVGAGATSGRQPGTANPGT